ncbi:MAG: single-stranded DNA-binding protein [Phycisphaerae bacterium]|nr:single-stranded DNA-binding protein [Phycisphaerae bacterium]
MANLNKVMLMGNLTRDIRLTYLPSNTPVAEFGIATNRTWVGQDGQKHEEATLVELRMFDKRAEVLNKYLHKGDPLFVEGRLHLDSWDDKQTGQKRSKTVVMVEDFQFLGRAGGGAPREGGPGPAAGAAPRRPAAAAAAPADASSEAPPPADDYNTDVQPPEPENDNIPF